MAGTRGEGRFANEAISTWCTCTFLCACPCPRVGVRWRVVCTRAEAGSRNLGLCTLLFQCPASPAQAGKSLIVLRDGR